MMASVLLSMLLSFGTAAQCDVTIVPFRVGGGTYADHQSWRNSVVKLNSDYANASVHFNPEPLQDLKLHDQEYGYWLRVDEKFLSRFGDFRVSFRDGNCSFRNQTEGAQAQKTATISYNLMACQNITQVALTRLCLSHLLYFRSRSPVESMYSSNGSQAFVPDWGPVSANPGDGGRISLEEAAVYAKLASTSESAKKIRVLLFRRVDFTVRGQRDIAVAWGDDSIISPDLRNIIFVDRLNVWHPTYPHLLSHEIGHVLLNGDASVHCKDSENVMASPQGVCFVNSMLPCPHLKSRQTDRIVAQSGSDLMSCAESTGGHLIEGVDWVLSNESENLSTMEFYIRERLCQLYGESILGIGRGESVRKASEWKELYGQDEASAESVLRRLEDEGFVEFARDLLSPVSREPLNP